MLPLFRDVVKEAFGKGDLYKVVLQLIRPCQYDHESLNSSRLSVARVGNIFD